MLPGNHNVRQGRVFGEHFPGIRTFEHLLRAKQLACRIAAPLIVNEGLGFRKGPRGDR